MLTESQIEIARNAAATQKPGYVEAVGIMYSMIYKDALLIKHLEELELATPQAVARIADQTAWCLHALGVICGSDPEAILRTARVLIAQGRSRTRKPDQQIGGGA